MSTLQEYWTEYYSERHKQATLGRSKRSYHHVHKYTRNMAPYRDVLPRSVEPRHVRALHAYRKHSQIQRTTFDATTTEKTTFYDRDNSPDGTNPVEMLRTIFAEYNIEETPLEVLKDARRRV